MALLAEEIVQEWLNRQGYFTIRGIKMGVQEIDLLAIKFAPDGSPECRHIEVQASMRPISYISKVPKLAQTAGRAAGSVKRSSDELLEGVAEWVEKKFTRADKRALLLRLCKGDWTSELVINVVKSDHEVEIIASHGIKILHLSQIVSSLLAEDYLIASASGADIVDLIQMGSVTAKND